MTARDFILNFWREEKIYSLGFFWEKDDFCYKLTDCFENVVYTYFKERNGLYAGKWTLWDGTTGVHPQESHETEESCRKSAEKNIIRKFEKGGY